MQHLTWIPCHQARSTTRLVAMRYMSFCHIYKHTNHTKVPVPAQRCLNHSSNIIAHHLQTLHQTMMRSIVWSFKTKSSICGAQCPSSIPQLQNQTLQQHQIHMIWHHLKIQTSMTWLVVDVVLRFMWLCALQRWNY